MAVRPWSFADSGPVLDGGPVPGRPPRPPRPGDYRRRRQRQPASHRAVAAVRMDEERARRLYVSNRPEDHAINYDFEADIKERQQTEARYAEASKGVMDFKKVTYRSSVGDMEIPAYLFQPLKKRGPAGTRRWSGCTAACTATGASTCSRS